MSGDLGLWGKKAQLIIVMHTIDGGSLVDLNKKLNYDGKNFMNQFIIDDDNEVNIFAGLSLESSYFDLDAFKLRCRSENNPIILSLNVQSLLSKLNELNIFLNELSSNDIHVNVIAIQETWAVPYPDSVVLPGFQKIALKCRRNSRGGGVGFFIREGIEFKIIDNLSPFIENIVESITVELIINKTKILLTSIYRSGSHF